MTSPSTNGCSSGRPQRPQDPGGSQQKAVPQVIGPGGAPPPHPAALAEAPLADPADLDGWVIYEDADLLVVSKPGWLVCHPSKRGPYSSFVGAFREHTGLGTLHLVSRLDRETSGLVIFAKNPATARRYQMAIQGRETEKTYLAVLVGPLDGRREIDQPLAKDLGSPVHVKVAVRRSHSAKSACTIFEPVAVGGGFTLARVQPVTGRKHQIRAHAHWLGHPVAGDKLYGADDSLYLEFVQHGWTPRLARALPLPRQALHASRLTFRFPASDPPQVHFRAPLAPDLATFCREVVGLPQEVIDTADGHP